MSLGNFLADFLKGKEIEELNHKTKKGVILHRRIDRFTDSHPQVIEAVRILSKTQGRYASVIVDVFFDYFLANNWDLFTTLSLEDFVSRNYKVLENKREDIPEKVKPALDSLITHDWFNNYKNIFGMEKAIFNIKRRASFENNLDNAIEDLNNLKDDLEPLFLDFYPDLINMATLFFGEYYINFNQQLIRK